MNSQGNQANSNDPNQDDTDQESSGSASYGTTSDEEHFTESISFADELGVKDLRQPLRDSRGKVFSAAGRNAPVAEFTSEFLVLHPPDKPFQDADEGPAEEIVVMMDETGVLVDSFGVRKNIPGAKFEGRQLFCFWEQKPGTYKHYAVFFDEEGNHHYLTVEGERITVDIVYKLRNMTHDGELTRFKELTPE
ncbi:MAG: hypothetical protein K2X93_10195 [Candidatus Obscuribacterales bacterium]|nr:hypothetical protein [Candidatus Obscuribacterales bacterium]